MATCDLCGRPITFRKQGGRAIPYHFDGTCSATVGSGSARTFSGLTQTKDRVCHLTRCRCGASVFFIRHNGGSVWINPPLGRPWDEHECEFVVRPAKSLVERSYLKNRPTKGHRIGVVTETDVNPNGTTSLVSIALGRSKPSKFVVQNRAGFLAGHMVFLNTSGGKGNVTVFDNGNISFAVLAELADDLSICPLCGANVEPGTVVSHIRRHHWY
jgi:hypothetical protein